MEKEFPSHDELNVASALLLLSSPTVFPPSPTTQNSPLKLKENAVEIESEVSKKCDDKSIDTTPCNSSLTTVDSVARDRDRDRDRRNFKLNASQFRELKLKVARRARTKVIYRGTKWAPKMWANTPLKYPKKVTSSIGGTTTTESSCLSSGGSSEISSARKEEKAMVVEKKRKRGVGSTHIIRKAEGIRRFLSNGVCASEVRIRQVLGDSPDTSKALRMLLRKEEVKRSGAGGRSDPFIYTIVADNTSLVC